MDIKHMVERLAPGLSVMQKSMQLEGSPEELAGLAAAEAAYLEGGFPAALARRTILLQRLFPVLDVVETAAHRKMDVENVARIYFGLGESLRLKWLQEQLENLPVEGQWHALARANLRDELYSIQNILVESVLREEGKRADAHVRWMKAHRAQTEKVCGMLNDMINLPAMDYATVAVAIRALGNMLKSNGT
jgi:glutamate dehydrogenase